MKTKKSNLKEEPVKEEPIEKELKKPVVKVKEKVKLFMITLRNLPYKVKKRDLKELFRPLTPATIRIPPKVKGIAYVGFKTEKDMKRALAKNKSFLSKY